MDLTETLDYLFIANENLDIKNMGIQYLFYPETTICIPYMHPKMHCKVEGKLLAAVIDRQKIDISFPFKAGLAGVTLDSEPTL